MNAAIHSYVSLEQAYVSELEAILLRGYNTAPRTMSTIEILGATLRITNPRARLIIQPARGWSVFYALGELFWHLSASRELDFIAYYSRRWRDYSDDFRTIRGSCYGARIFAPDRHGICVWDKVLGVLRDDPDTRRAVISFYSNSDLDFADEGKDIPCSCNLQFLARDGKLNALVQMRSNDAMLGFGYDVFTFTMLQELMASILGYELGWYQHTVGSFHIYDKDRSLAERIITEGPSSDTLPMAAMCHPEEIPAVLSYERRIRTANSVDPHQIFNVNLYWQEILLLLLLYKCKRLGDDNGRAIVSERLAGSCYSALLLA